MSDDHIIDRMFAALSAGDVAAACACFGLNATIWHGFDAIAQTAKEVAISWKAMIAHFPERGVVDVRRQPTPTGFVQQHLWTARTADGRAMAWPVCVVVQITDGLIARLDEYIDRAGSFTLPAGKATTPGM